MIFSNHQKQLLSLGFDRQNYPAAKCVTNYFVASSIVDGEKAANEYLTSLINVLKKGKRMEKWTRELLFHTIQTIGVLYRDLLQSKRNEFLSFKSYIECRVLLDFIDQRKLNPTNQKMFQSIQDEIEQIQQKLHKTENDAKKVSHVVKNQGINVNQDIVYFLVVFVPIESSAFYSFSSYSASMKKFKRFNQRSSI